MRFSFIFGALILFAGACSTQPSYRDGKVPLATAPSVDLDRYMGKWFEIARLPNSFEKNCEGVTAEYALDEGQKVRVINTCRKGSIDGKIDVAKGRAKVVDQQTNAKLKVSFFGPFWGDYWILKIADDYSLSIVGEPQGKYLWILSRTPKISDAVRDEALAKLQSLGYDTSALYFTKQAAVAG